MNEQPIFFRRRNLKELSAADLMTEWIVIPSGTGATAHFEAVVAEMRRRGFAK